MRAPVTKFIHLICLLLLQQIVYGQKRFAIDLSAGMTRANASIPSLPGYMGSISLRYNFNPVLSFEAMADLGMIRGKQNVTTFTGTDYPENFKSFTTNFQMFSGNFNVNLARVFKFTGERSRINPYFVFGIGSLQNDAKADRIDNKIRAFNYITYQWVTGFAIRYYLNPTIDLKTGFNYYFTQTYYMDAIHKDLVYDQYYNVYLGLSWKIGASKSEEHIEWKDLIRNRSMKRSQKKKIKGKLEVELPQETPKDIAENKAHELTEGKPIESVNPEDKKATLAPPMHQESKPSEVSKEKGSTTTVTDSLKAVITFNNHFQSAQKDTVSHISGALELDTIHLQVFPPQVKSTKDTLKIAQLQDSLIIDLTKPISKPIDSTELLVNGISGNVSNIPPIAIAPVQKYRPSKIEIAESIPSTKELSVKTKVSTKKLKLSKDWSGIDSENTNPKQAKNLSDEGIVDAETVIPPIARYNVIVASFYSLRYARRFALKLKQNGHDVHLFKSKSSSKLIRVSVYSNSSKNSTLDQMRRIRTDMEPDAWIHIYKGQ